MERLEELCNSIKEVVPLRAGKKRPESGAEHSPVLPGRIRAHVNEKRCPAKVCKPLIHYEIDLDKCTGCGRCRQKVSRKAPYRRQERMPRASTTSCASAAGSARKRASSAPFTWPRVRRSALPGTRRAYTFQRIGTIRWEFTTSPGSWTRGRTGTPGRSSPISRRGLRGPARPSSPTADFGSRCREAVRHDVRSGSRVPVRLRRHAAGPCRGACALLSGITVGNMKTGCAEGPAGTGPSWGFRKSSFSTSG